MSKRFYHACPRLTGANDDVQPRQRRLERRFYYCVCGERTTYNTRTNGAPDDWPEEVFADAVQRKVLTAAGRVL